MARRGGDVRFAKTSRVLSSYSLAYLVLGAMLAVTLIETLRLAGDAGSHVSG